MEQILAGAGPMQKGLFYGGKSVYEKVPHRIHGMIVNPILEWNFSGVIHFVTPEILQHTRTIPTH
jgi:hypothetical protein